MLQHSRQTLTSRQQRQLWQKRRSAHQARRAMRKQQLLQQRAIPKATPKRRPRSARRHPAPVTQVHLPNRLPRQVSPTRPSSLRRSPERITRRRPARGRQQRGLFSYLACLVIAGSGVAAIAGTILAIIDPQQQFPSSTPAVSSSALPAIPPRASNLSPGPKPKTFSHPQDAPTSLLHRWSQEPRMTRLIREGQELSDIKQQIQQWSAAQDGLTPVMFFLNPDTGDFLNINGEQRVSAASTIKIPILLAFFEDVDAGKIALDESLVMRQDLVASEAGSMQYQPVGTQFSALETAEYMIEISDNTATNMLIDRLGGAEQLNQRFRTWGLKQTNLRNPLPDLEGTNTVSPQDMAALMLKLNDETTLSASSRKQALAILRKTVTKTLLPQGLEADATIAHKTGDIGSVVGDIGLIDMPNGQSYVAAILVDRPHNDPRAQELIRKISKLTYQTFRHNTQPPRSANLQN